MIYLYIMGFLFLFIKFFSKKLLALLCLEGSMLVMILFLVSLYGGNIGSTSSVSMLLVIMMVLDSVMGLCLLVSFSRNSLHFNSFYSSF